MLKTTVAIGVSSLAFVLFSVAHAKPMEPEGATAEFITKAAQSDEFERREGRLVATHGHSIAVKKFGAEMVTAHSRTSMSLKSAIHHAHLTVPSKPELTDEQTHMLADLKAMHGGNFDKAYVEQQLKAHQETLSVIQDYAQNGPPGPIQNAAKKTIPIVEQHIEMVKGIQAKL